MNDLRRIVIRPDALILIERILATCIDMDKTVEDLRFPTNQSVTLEDLRQRFPIPAIGLYKVCDDDNQIIRPWDIVRLFAGPIHAQAVKDRLENPKQIIVATGQLFLDRMKELGIHFSVPQNQATFGLLDLAMPAKVKDYHERKCQLKIWEISLANAVIPAKLRLNRGQWVLTHMGGVISKLQESHVYDIRQLQKQGISVELIGEIMAAIKDKNIDCENFCPSSPRNKDGCNLAAWNLGRL